MKQTFSIILLLTLCVWGGNTHTLLAQKTSAKHSELSSFDNTESYTKKGKTSKKQKVKKKKKKDMTPSELAVFKAERKEKRKKFWSTVGKVVLVAAAVATVTYLSMEEAEQARLANETGSDRAARQKADAAVARSRQMTPAQQQQMVSNMDASTRYYYYLRQSQQQGGQSGQNYNYKNYSDLSPDQAKILMDMNTQLHETNMNIINNFN